MRKRDLFIFFWILLLTIALFSAHNFLQTDPASPLSPSKSSSATTKLENLLRRTVFSGPGLYFQDKLFIWGARVTHSLDDEKIYFDMFVFGTRYIHLIQSKYQPPLNQVLLEEARIITFKLECISNYLITPCHIFRNNNVDPNSAFYVLRFRCLLLNQNLTNNLNHVEVEIQSRVHGSVYFNIPKNTDFVGLAGPENELATNFREQKPVDLTLCVGGISEIGVDFLAEFLQHHIRMGVDRFIIGIHSNPFVRNLPETYEKVRNLTLPLIKNGVVLLFPMIIPEEILQISRDILKMLFYEACLFHSKGTSIYIANWDVDEFWMPVNKSWPTLKAVVKAFKPKPACPDWCFMSFPSYSVWQPANTYQTPLIDIKQIAETFQVRKDEAPNYVWQKSVAKTKNAFNSGCKSCFFFNM